MSDADARSAPRPAAAGAGVLKRFALALGSTVISLLLAELVLRALSIGQPVFRDIDPVLGWAPIPGAEGRYDREGHAHVVIPESGFRGVLVDHTKPAGTFRLVLLGDSYTEAKQVALEDSFGARLEAPLAECLGRDVEVLAFGVSGYGTAQERLLLEHRARAYEPDAVMLALLTGNDIADNHPALRGSDDRAPFYRLDGEELVLDTSFRESEWYRSREQGGLLRDIARESRLLRLLLATGAARQERSEGELGLRDEIYREPADTEWQDAWRWTEAILAATNEDLAADEIPFFVVTLSNAIQVDPDPARRARYAERLGVTDLDYPNRRLAVAGARDGYPVLDLVPPLRAYAEERGLQLHGFENTAMGTGHWNERGHEVAAAEMARFLCDALAR